MKINYLCAVVMAIVATTDTYAMCYSIYNGDNTLIFQSAKAPVSMNNESLTDAVNQRFPGASMIIRSNPCSYFDLKESQANSAKVKPEKKQWYQSVPAEHPSSVRERLVTEQKAQAISQSQSNPMQQQQLEDQQQLKVRQIASQQNGLQRYQSDVAQKQQMEDHRRLKQQQMEFQQQMKMANQQAELQQYQQQMQMEMESQRRQIQMQQDQMQQMEFQRNWDRLRGK